MYYGAPCGGVKCSEIDFCKASTGAMLTGHTSVFNWK
jgi:hypothetical protein